MKKLLLLTPLLAILGLVSSHHIVNRPIVKEAGVANVDNPDNLKNPVGVSTAIDTTPVSIPPANNITTNPAVTVTTETTTTPTAATAPAADSSVASADSAPAQPDPSTFPPPQKTQNATVTVSN